MSGEMNSSEKIPLLSLVRFPIMSFPILTSILVLGIEFFAESCVTPFILMTSLRLYFFFSMLKLTDIFSFCPRIKADKEFEVNFAIFLAVSMLGFVSIQFVLHDFA